jgi:FtsH-binding integral membrane protein
MHRRIKPPAMAEPVLPKGMLAVAVVFVSAALVLVQQTWTASSRVHVPAGIAYVIAAVLITAAIMVTLRVFGILGANDLLAAGLLLGVTVEMTWLAAGSGPRHCSIGLWSPPEPVCRAALWLCALMCVVLTAWAIRRHWTRSRAG